MTDTTVVDASVLVAALLDESAPGTWAEEFILGSRLAGPHLVFAEAANIIRRGVLHGQVIEETGELVQVELLDLDIELFPFAPYAQRAWELRRNVTTYDAWYVALAESLDCPLATLDARLARATGPTCPILLPKI